jgi:hypothetical protein
VKVEIEVRELVLHGFDPRDGRAIGEAVERELARLVRARGVETAAPQDVARADGGAFPLPANARGAAAGAPIARAVFGAIKR